MSKHWVTPSRSSPKPGGNRATSSTKLKLKI